MAYLLGQEHRLHGLFDALDGTVERPDVCLEAEARLHSDLVLVVQQDHAFTDVSAGLTQPFLAVFQRDQDRAHLPSLHALHRNPVAVDALDLDDAEGGLRIRPHERLLVYPEHALVHNACHNDQLV